ncbi:MerR family transcriptional regulator [Oscillospiraceae bacterium MB08-C2-2]|nr:MerR family transcriptional regulator [Oscillospiraceae bacterium MB08-C2-2]
MSYSTSAIAKIAAVHPNTVRYYEAIGYLPAVHRKANGYRVFTDVHIEQLKLIKIAHRSEILQNNLREKTTEIIRLCAQNEYEQALANAREYQTLICVEEEKAMEAVRLVNELLNSQSTGTAPQGFTRRKAAESLGVTMDALRNWELNGLIEIPRKVNGYRFYTEKEMRELKITRVLRNANYSLMAILRMLHQLRGSPNTDLRKALDTPSPQEDIVYVTDRLLTSLMQAKRDAGEMVAHILQRIK